VSVEPGNERWGFNPTIGRLAHEVPAGIEEYVARPSDANRWFSNHEWHESHEFNLSASSSSFV
jgi:hypothetical protein